MTRDLLEGTAYKLCLFALSWAARWLWDTSQIKVVYWGQSQSAVNKREVHRNVRIIKMNLQNRTDRLEINHVPRVFGFHFQFTFPSNGTSHLQRGPLHTAAPPWSWSSTSQRRAWDWRPLTKLCLCLQGLITLDFHMLCYLNYAIYMKKVISRHRESADHTLMGRYLCTDNNVPQLAPFECAGAAASLCQRHETGRWFESLFLAT